MPSGPISEKFSPLVPRSHTNKSSPQSHRPTAQPRIRDVSGTRGFSPLASYTWSQRQGPGPLETCAEATAGQVPELTESLPSAHAARTDERDRPRPAASRPATPSRARAVRSPPEATAPPAPASPAAKRKGKASSSSSSPPRSRRALAVAMAASLLVLAVAVLVAVGPGGIDGGAAAPVEVEGSEVRVQD